jgi:hypothetical protein
MLPETGPPELPLPELPELPELVPPELLPLEPPELPVPVPPEVPPLVPPEPLVPPLVDPPLPLLPEPPPLEPLVLLDPLELALPEPLPELPFVPLVPELSPHAESAAAVARQMHPSFPSPDVMAGISRCLVVGYRDRFVVLMQPPISSDHDSVPRTLLGPLAGSHNASESVRSTRSARRERGVQAARRP